jgi:type IV pilus assembly protein PilB
MADNQTTAQHLNDINQEFKEKEVQKKAEGFGIPYINLLAFKVNPDVLQLLHKEESESAHMVVFFQIGKKIRIALTDPENIHAKEFLQRLKNENFIVNINIASIESIVKVQEIYSSSLYVEEKKDDIYIKNEDKLAREALEEFEQSQEKELSQKKSSDALNDIHSLAVQMHVSDIHFQREKTEVKIRFRIDGILQSITTIEPKIYDRLVRQIKMNANLKLNIVNEPQDGQYMFSVNKREVDVRVSFLPSVYGESIVLRFLDSKKSLMSLADLGFKKYSLEKIAQALSKTEGMILLTGPTGSGKTTTLYSMIQVLNKPQRKIITLEDPVEYKMEGVVQCEVHQEEAETETVSYESGLKSVLRQDPDVIMVGEIREPKVARTAVQASMTGHLVLSTLHSNSALETFARLKDLEVSDYLLHPSMNAIIAQRLVRKVCDHCKETRERSSDHQNIIRGILTGLDIKHGFDLQHIEKEIYGKGCKICNKSGYLKRLTIVEVLLLTTALKEVLRVATIKDLGKQAVADGFVTIKQDGMLKVLEGLTTFEEVIRVTG